MLSAFGPEWMTTHRREGIQTVLFGTNLVSDPAHNLKQKSPSAILGRLYIVTMLRNFLASGSDMAVCRMRRKSQMDKHGEFVGGKKEGEVYVPGKDDELADIMTISREVALSFPFEALGPSFDEFWKGRATAWHQARRPPAKL